jgi:hypothetical protein
VRISECEIGIERQVASPSAVSNSEIRNIKKQPPRGFERTRLLASLS